MFCPACNGTVIVVQGPIARRWINPYGDVCVELYIGKSVICTYCPVVSELRGEYLVELSITLEDLRAPFVPDDGDLHVCFKAGAPVSLHGRKDS